jgi:hypothetical protein
MAKMDRSITKCRLKAINDSGEIFLYVECDDDVLVEIPWPKTWPEKVTDNFLNRQGFTVSVA